MAKFTIDKGQSTASPAVINTARELGLSPANRRTPASISGTMQAPKPQTTLIPSQLEQQGRAGGSNKAPVTSRTPSIEQSDYARTPGANLPSGVTPIPGKTTTGNLTPPVNNSTGGGVGGSDPTSTTTETTETASGGVDAQAALDAAINRLLEGDFIGFQGSRAEELRRLQNLRNQLYGDTETGLTGSIQRQEGIDAQARRRLAAQRAMAGMLQGGAYAGPERGLGSIQQGEQAFNLQEMQRPFRENVMSDRLKEFGLSYDPTSRVFNLMDFGAGDDGSQMTNWSQQTFAGRAAAARARAAAIAQLAQQGIVI